MIKSFQSEEGVLIYSFSFSRTNHLKCTPLSPPYIIVNYLFLGEQEAAIKTDLSGSTSDIRLIVMWCGRRSSHRWFSCLEAKDPRYPPPHPDSALHHTLTNFPLILPNLNSCQTYKSHQPQPQPLTLIIEAETSGSVQELILQLQPSVLASIFNIFLFSINQLWKCGKDGNGITAHYDPTSLWFSTRQIP